MATSDVGAPRWVLDALSDVYDPCCREKGISVVDMGLLRSATVNGTHARVELLLTSGWCPFASCASSPIPPPFPTATRSSPHSVRRPRRSTDDR